MYNNRESRNIFSFLITHDEFYESLDNYSPNQQDFLLDVKKQLPKNWQINRNNAIWYHCSPPQEIKLPQGWKIHISATVKNAKEILKETVPILVQSNTSFKFLVDLWIFRLLNSKNWYRGGAGKFITIYPKSEESFRELIEDIYRITKNFEGPYILSDRRYRDSKVVYYRYGGIYPEVAVNVYGYLESFLVGPDGQRVLDVRLPYYVLPEWVSDPFSSESKIMEKNEQITLKNGRYLVIEPISYSNSGGVYLATDSESGKSVIVKEARPFIGFDTSGRDAISLLKKEYRILQKVEKFGFSPKVLDFFQEWEHYFLIEEYLEGITLREYSATNNPILLRNPQDGDKRKFIETFLNIFYKMTSIIKLLHENRIVFSDISPDNIILQEKYDGSYDPMFVDFEGAYDIDIDEPTFIFTPGFAIRSQILNESIEFESDYYSLGSLMLYYFIPINGLLDIKPSASKIFLHSIFCELGYSPTIKDMIISLMSHRPQERPTPENVLETIRKERICIRIDRKISTRKKTNNKNVCSVTMNTINKIVDYILYTADYRRKDRLFPADIEVFQTNPLSLAYGACGIALVIHKIRGSVPDEIIEWIKNIQVNPLLYPPGLYVGLSGIAWCLLELGLNNEAKVMLEYTYNHPLLFEDCDLFYGVSGWGMTNLYFWLTLGDNIYLEKAEEAANHIISVANLDENGYYWPAQDRTIHIGFAHGSSGIALFLLYLYLATNNNQLLTIGKKALEYDIRHAVKSKSGGLTWSPTTDYTNTVLPYWRYGSAGVGTTVLRYWKILGDSQYREILTNIFIDVDRKYVIFPGKFTGLAGLGDFVLDMYQFMQKPIYYESALKIAEGIDLFKIKKRKGIAFPGDNLHRISCDYGTGSAGVAMFLYRLVTGTKNMFLLDELIYRKQKV